MVSPAKSQSREASLRIRLARIPPVPIDEIEIDPAEREAAWTSFVAFARRAKAKGGTRDSAHPYGTRDEWYDDMINEGSE